MRIPAFCALAGTFIGILFGQTTADQNVARVFRCTQPDAQQNLPQMALVIHVVSDAHAVANTEQGTLSVSGTSAQLELIDWLFTKLDQPAPAKRECRDFADDLVCVLPEPTGTSVQDSQDAATLVRSSANVRRLDLYHPQQARVLRASSEQIALAEWLFGQISANRQSEDAAAHAFRMPHTSDDMVRIFYLNPNDTLQQFNQLVTQVRTTTRIPRVFAYNATRAVAVRGTPAQIESADRLFREMKQ